MASPEYLRFYDSTIRLLAERGHHVLLAVIHQKDGKPVRLEQLDAIGQVEIAGIATTRDDIWAPMARLVRGAADYIRYLHPRFADAPVLRQRLARKGLPPALRGVDRRIGTCRPATVDRLLRVTRVLERGIPVSRSVQRFIAAHHPDVVFVSPLIDTASEQVDFVRAARRLRIPAVAGIASWDNLTNKGLLRVEPDAVLVWNEAQKREAVELHGVSADRVIVTGAQLFDKWFQRTPSRSLDTFANRVGLPRAERFILFTGSSMFISAAELEVPFVRRWLKAIRDSGHPVLRETPILVRPHPYNGWIWADQDLSEFGDVAIWPRGTFNPVEADHRDDFFDSLYYSRAVVGINTSAMVEAAILGRPVHSVITDDFARTQEGTLHFHHLLPEHGGFLQVGRGFEHHASLLAASLADEAGARAQAKSFVSAFLRPHGVDRDCTPIVVDALERISGVAPMADDGAVVSALARVPSALLLPAARVLMARRPKEASRSGVVHELRRVGRLARKRLDKATKVAARRGRRIRKDLQVLLKGFGV